MKISVCERQIYVYVCMYYSEITVNVLHHIALYTCNKDIKHFC